MAIYSMSLKSQDHYRVRANIAKAMGHPSRMLILDALKDGELCVCELTPLLGVDQSTVSRHLAVLKQAGLIQDRKEGSSVYYRLLCGCLDGFFNCIEKVLAEAHQRQKKLLK
jgi:ArsR family transcriptional regulator, arsenate/arsenite/antimonite-responsive transcriptional repressor